MLLRISLNLFARRTVVPVPIHQYLDILEKTKTLTEPSNIVSKLNYNSLVAVVKLPLEFLAIGKVIPKMCSQ